jgi:hypothetical protein
VTDRAPTALAVPIIERTIIVYEKKRPLPGAVVHLSAVLAVQAVDAHRVVLTRMV